MAYETGSVPPPNKQETEDAILARKLQEEFNRMDAAAEAPMGAGQQGGGAPVRGLMFSQTPVPQGARQETSSSSRARGSRFSF